MRYRWAGGFIIVAVLALAGCTPTASYLVRRTNASVAIGIPRCTSAPLATIALKGVGGEEDPIWSIRRTSEGDPDQSVFTLGEAPEGFEEVVPLEVGELEDEDRLWPDVNPSFGGLGILRLGDVPADGRVYRVDVNGKPEPVAGFVALEDDTMCGSDRGVVGSAAATLLMIIVVAVALPGFVIWMWWRRDPEGVSSRDLS